MDPLVNWIGRPFGGVGFICDKDQFVFEILGCDSDRVCQVVKNECILATVVGRYLPYEDGSQDQIYL